MSHARAAAVFQVIDSYELSLCLRFNRASAYPVVRPFFAVVSRLGDGVFWYAVMVLLPFVYGWHDIRAAGRMAVVGVAGVAVYKFLKGRLVRQRPFVNHAGIRLGTAPLDRYSFPSGHTLHACAFTVVAVSYHPPLAWVLVPFTVLVALSRVILGLHYPSDVLAGALLGTGLAALSMVLF